MKLRCSIVGIVLFALLYPSALRAQDGLRGALSHAAKAAYAFSELSPKIAAADFDNDQKPDGAILVETGLMNGKRAFRVELHLTADDNNEITFSSTEAGLSISALDVNRDGATDIVIERLLTHERLQIYLNDGHGAFHKARIEDYPSPDSSRPDWSAGFANGLPAFCLPCTRGFEVDGPRQIRALPLDACGHMNLPLDALVILSGARAPNSSRAPPTLRSL